MVERLTNGGVRKATVAALATAVVAISLSALGSPAGAEAAPPPAVWPQSPNASPRIEGHPNGVRIAGSDRYSTSLALALTLRGTGDYPFSTPDRSLGGATGLETTSAWWGVGTCPRAVIVVAGDSPADALAASALSDPTDLSTEPFLQRTAAADPLFDVPGGFARVDTDSAPILITGSARQGETNLSVATRIAAQDLTSGGCALASQAIIVGGTAAVPASVDDELVSIGYREVFRVSGPTRYDTAAAVARSLDTAPAPSAACFDAVTDDGSARMAFYANSVIEYRTSATDCRVLGRTVVLADGLTGADALAAGWWTSFWQVPVLLHDGSAALPTATREALETMQVDHVVVLGGTARLSESVVNQVRNLTGAEVFRVSGPDRYATSVEMAKRFGGWWPTGDGADFEASMVCLAASSGEGGGAKGWPDALSAGPWCGAASGAASNPGAPQRALAPIVGAHPRTSAGGPSRPARDAVPVLLVPVSAQFLPPVVSQLLHDAFDDETTWCASAGDEPCRLPGFVVAFGGAATVAEATLAAASRLVGGSTTAAGQPPVRHDPMFYTRLDMTPVFANEGAGAHRICASRDGYAGARWLGVFSDTSATRLLSGGDVMLGGLYLTDADSVARSPGVGAPTCVAFDPGAATNASVRAVAPTGRTSDVDTFSFAAANRVAMSAALSGAGPTSASGIDSALDPAAGGATNLTFIWPAPGISVTSGAETHAVTAATLHLTLARGASTAAPDEFTATWSLDTVVGGLTGSAEGEARLVEGKWELRGRSEVSGGWNVSSGMGGFRATLDPGTPGDFDDDSVTWLLDALITAS